MSRLTRLATSLELALETSQPVLVFGAWQPTDSLAAGVVLLLLTLIHRLKRLPLNPILACAPFSRLDDVALERTVCVARVVKSRQLARVGRWQAGCQQPKDLEQCDWEIAAQVLSAANASTRLGLTSFVGVDRINRMGSLDRGSRPVLGRYAKNGARLPQLCVLTVRSRSEAAIAALSRGTLTL